MPLGPIDKRLVFMALWLIALTTAGCDMSMPSPQPPRGGSEVRTEKLKTNIPLEDARDIAKPIGDTPGLSVDVDGAQNAAGIEGAMEPARGLSVRLFDTSVSDDERFERLESAVQKLRDDFDAVSPSINRLVAIEREIQGLVDQLEVLVGDQGGGAMDASGVPPVAASMVEDDTAALPVQQAVPDPLPPQDMIVPQQPAATASAASVVAMPPETQAPAVIVPAAQTPAPAPVASYAKNINIIKTRAANHAKMTRLVIEMDSMPDYEAVLTPDNHLRIQFKNTGINDNFEDKISSSSLVSGASQVENDTNGKTLSIPLKSASRIVTKGVLKPDGESRTYRLYIDLAL